MYINMAAKNDVKNHYVKRTRIQGNAARWQLAEVIQDHIDKLNALVDGMMGEDFQDIQLKSRSAYISVLTDYLQLLGGDFRQLCELWEIWQQEQNDN